MAAANLITEKSALVAFKNHIVSDPHLIVAKNWSISSSVCDWIGVTCDFNNQRVVALNISNMGFAGTIPPQLRNLSFLVSLDMSNNNFHGHLSEGMSHLRRLSFMALSNNHLTGEIPSWLGVLERLQYLSLTENNFFGHLPANICDSLPNLKELYLSMNQLSGQILSGLSNCSGLKSLYLSSNQFDGYIPKAVGNLKMLEELHLDYNKLEGYFLGFLLFIQFHIYILIGDNIIGNIIQMRKKPKNENMHENVNNFTGAIAVSIPNCSKLTFISHGYNKFCGGIPISFGKLRHLEFLELIDNNLTSESSFPDLSLFISLAGCISPGKISVSGNPLNGGNIPWSIGNLSNLIVLSLQGNHLTGFIPYTMNGFTSCKGCYLSMNHFSGDIASTIGSLQYLMYLSLANNSLQGAIPSTVGNMLSLETFNLSHNNLSGLIPKSMTALRHLKYFKVSFNDLRGEIPTGGPSENFTHEPFLFNKDLSGLFRFCCPPAKLFQRINQGKSRCFYLCLFFLVRAHGRIPYCDFMQATNGYHESNLIGMGSFGTVYKGKLDNGMLVAVKVFNLQI
ncbi:unnamed protein product [Coffea canephora]|uniref:Protein kinase domain-containing protein n=1 Tax=Coffea canephora TaxID=49390 RepID=A0A068VAN2_COFCA|nr:unnamed protein product [Coffea canephora]